MTSRYSAALSWLRSGTYPGPLEYVLTNRCAPFPPPAPLGPHLGPGRPCPGLVLACVPAALNFLLKNR